MAVPNAVRGKVVGVTQNHVSLNLLDGFRLQVNSAPVEVSESAQRLVAFVALGERPLCRSLVAGTLWPENSESRAFANLRSSLWRLNASGLGPMIVCSGSSLLLHPKVGLDVATLQRQGWALVDRAAGQTPELRPDGFSKELLPGWYDDWVIVERERLGQLQIRFLEALVHHLRERGDLTRAIDQAMRLVAIDPLREGSQIALIRALVDEGSWGRARWQAEQYSALLDGAFDCRASEAFMTAYRVLLPFDRVLTS